MWRKTQKTLATFIPLVLLLVYLTVAICLLNRWDAMVAVTLPPVWVWSGLGMTVALLCWIICGGLPSIVMFCLCLATGIAFSEETIGISRELVIAVRGEKKESPESPPLLKVVNVNCSGSEASLRKAIESGPDVVIIQEAPEKAILNSVADQLYGVARCVSVHQTNAIIARGEILGELSEAESATLHTRIKLPGGFIVDVTNLDLKGCAPRLDMWRPAVWKQLIVARTENRRLVRASLGENEITRENIGRIISGGFGTPPGDDVYRPLETNGLVDTYAAAGLGWGNTYPPDYPLLRLDQIWVSTNLTPVRSLTRLNTASDHRIVVSEVRLPVPRPPKK
ncbi:MAG TPA: endonuclease/exonuclease/phosphatase family protein [Verrucomicrobiales bacterium]|nr:endonuclease/exonuclease/phosphatase family protein [Verrucomicrobiales bacterium]